MKVPLSAKIKLAVVRQCIALQNFFLCLFERLLFRKIGDSPRHILVFKVGNIGDIVCAIPSFIAIRRAYPKAKITLLTSPGSRSVPGAQELLGGAWYFDEIKVYDSQDIRGFRKIMAFLLIFKKNYYDVFIHIPPHDWTGFPTMVRNMLFAKFIGARSACGFRVRTIINLFRKTQIDYSFGEKEVEALLKILREGGVPVKAVEFDFPIPNPAHAKIQALLKEKWGGDEVLRDSLLIALHSGSKMKEKKWAPEHFAEVVHYLTEKHNARLVILGGKEDRDDAAIIASRSAPEHVLIAAGNLSVIESVALIDSCDLLLCTDSGLMHVAAAFGKPVVALFSILNILGKWFPYGSQHEMLYHRFLNCDYSDPACIKKSVDLITVHEVEAACDRVISALS